MGREDRRDLPKRHAAVADRTPYEAISVVGELRDVVLEVHVADAVGGAAREGHRILADGKCVAGIEHDTDMLAQLLDQGDQFLAAEILVLLDGQNMYALSDTL